MLDLVVDARHVALLVLDAQNGFVASLPEPAAMLANTRTAIDVVRERGGHVGFVRLGLTPEEFDQIPPDSPMAMLVTPERRPHLAHDAAATQIHDRLAPRPQDIVVRKTRVGAFSTTDLGRQLDERGVTTVLLAGLATSGVVLATVLEAVERDLRTIVLTDACADPDAAAHAFVTATLAARHAHLTTVDELASLLGIS